MSKSILLICGSLNQTTIAHQIAQHLPQYDCWFTPFYADGLLGWMAKHRLLDFTILGGRHRAATEAYLKEHNLPVDFGGKSRSYDLVVTCTDLLIQKNIRGKRLVLVQEGMTEPENWLYHLVRAFKFPLFLANTAATGLSDAYDLFCVASPGYRDFFIEKGVKPNKIAVTGIPNFDNAKTYLQNPLPERDYVLVATSSIRETGKLDDRMRFLRQAKQLAAGRKVIFKLHPNENHKRARQEIRQIFPDAPILSSGNTNHLIANCSVLIAQVSSVVYVGLALGKEVHSYFDRKQLQRLLPIQNGGASAERIARLCQQLLRIPPRALQRFRQKGKLRWKWQYK